MNPNDSEQFDPAPPTSPSAPVRLPSDLHQAALLAFGGGTLDAFTYLGHGHVFANAMTGNVVLLGINFVTHGWRNCLVHLLPILSFLLGVSAAKALHHPGVQRTIRNPDLAAITLEILILATLSFLPGDGGTRTNPLWLPLPVGCCILPALLLSFPFSTRTYQE